MSNRLNNKRSSTAKSKRSVGSSEERRIAGGAATGGGINFQAAVTAIAFAYMLRGRPLKWLSGLCLDIPVAVAAETGGGGDDVRITLRGGKTCEVQVKRGLRSGEALWKAVMSMASSVSLGAMDFGVLVVSPSSSQTVRGELANAIIRIGGGRTDNLSEIGKLLLSKLTAAGLNAELTCQALRIVTVSAATNDDASIAAALAELGHICLDDTQISAAWNALYRDAIELIDHRGRRDISTLVHALKSNEVALAEDGPTPSAMLAKLTEWTIRISSTFAVFGVAKPLRMDAAWIPLRAVVHDDQIGPSDLKSAIATYHSWHDRQYSREAILVDPETLGRFIKLGVLIAGPGMGKTTLLKRVAHRYAIDGIPVLRVNLRTVAARLRHGDTFEEAVFALGLDGSGISASDAIAADLRNVVLLCDGLDETGASQAEIAAAAEKFAAGHPDCRVIVTTRPVGYHASNLRAWRHYDIVPLGRSEAPEQLATLLREIGGDDSDLASNAQEIAKFQLGDGQTTKAVTRSPLLLALSASVIARGGSLGSNRSRLYERLFKLVDEAPNSRVPEPPAEPVVLRRFLDVLGWEVVGDPAATVDQTLSKCATVLASEIGLKPLAATAAAETYLRYWQDVGLVERIGQNDSEALTFIHKTFGEFAAARYLVAMGPADRSVPLKMMCANDTWSEVLNFSALLGIADEVCVQLVDGLVLDPVGIDRLIQCIEILGESEPAPQSNVRATIFDFALESICSRRSQWAVDVALSLLPAARRFSDEIGSSWLRRTVNQQPWTRLAAWSVISAASRGDTDLVSLRRAIVNETVLSLGENWRDGPAIVIGSNTERDLAQAFVLEASRLLLDRLPGEETDRAVVAACKLETLDSVDFLERASRLLKEYGKSYNIWPEINLRDRPLLDLPTKFLNAQRIAHSAIFDAIIQSEREESAEPPISNGSSLMHLSAFLTLSEYMSTPVSDVWAWTQPYDIAAVHETVRATVAASAIDQEELRREAQIARAAVSVTEDGSFGWLQFIARVDAAPIDWKAAAIVEPDLVRIEAALYHRSSWVVWMAANLLDELADDEAKLLVIRRAIANGRGRTLWAAGGMAVSRGKLDLVSDVLDLLEQKQPYGSENLLTALQKLGPSLNDQLLRVIEKCLLQESPVIAQGASELAAHLATPDVPNLLPVLTRATAYWKKNEEPYPSQEGVIPKSPRAKIAEASAAIVPPSYEALKDYAGDSRSDVREFGSKMLIARVREKAEFIETFLNDLEKGDVPVGVLDKALEQGVTWDVNFLKRIEGFLISPNKRLRHAAMSLLEHGYRPPEFTQQTAFALSEDASGMVRTRAFRILDGLARK